MFVTSFRQSAVSIQEQRRDGEEAQKERPSVGNQGLQQIFAKRQRQRRLSVIQIPLFKFKCVPLLPILKLLVTSY